jgi:hypothetical protein
MFSFSSPVAITFNGAPVIAVATGDVNGDGRADIVAAVGGAGALGGVEVMLSKGSGRFSKPISYPVYNTQQVTAVAVADINGDGKLDIITGNAPPADGVAFGQTASISVLLGNGAGSFAAAQTYNNALPTQPSSLAVADFNGDGKPDIAASSQYGGDVDVLFNGANGGYWHVGSSYPVPAGGIVPSSVVAGDLNGDRKPDLVVANSSGAVYVLLNTGNGSFAIPQSYAALGNASTAAIGDFNGDGKLDIVTANGSTVSLFLGNGDGTFGSAQVFAAGGSTIGTGVRYIAVGDFNHDGKLDIVAGGGEMDILLGNGDGTFGAAQKVGPLGSNVVVADFNGDGFPDLAQIDGSGGSIDVLLNNADWQLKSHK